MNPIESYIEWLETQPKEVKETVSFLVGALAYGPKIDPNEEAMKDFYAWLRDCPGKYETAGKVITLKAMMDFTFKDWFTKEGQAKTLDRFLKVKAHAEKEAPNMVAMAERMIATKPERDAMWSKTGEEWAALKAGPLSDDTLNDLVLDLRA